MRRLALLTAVAALLTGPGPRPARAQLGDLDVERTVKKVEFHGNQTFSEGTLQKLLRTRGRGGFPFFRRRPLRLDYIRFDRLTLQDYYRRHGFLSARVDSVPLVYDASGNQAEVHFHLTEGPRARVESVRFEGVGPVPEDRLRRVLELRPGDPLDIAKQDLSREAIHNEYAERGYIAAVVRDSLEVEDTRVRIVYRVAHGPPVQLDSVLVEGTATTKPEFVMREVTVKPGELLRRSKLLQSQQRIYDTGFYSDVRFDRDEVDSATSSTDLIVNVRERKMGWIDAGIGYGTLDQLRLTNQIGQRNLWRAGVRVVATGLLGVRVRRHPTVIRLGDSRIDLALTRPWNFGARVAATAGGYAEQIFLRPYDQPNAPAYRAYGGSLLLSYDFSLVTHSRLAYEHRDVRSDTTSLRTIGGEERQRYTLNKIGASLERDTRDNVFDPRHGTNLIGTSEFVGGALKGSTQFLKNTGTAMAFVPVGRATTAAFRIRVGVINPQVAESESAPDSIGRIELIPVEERFFLGGATTIRGYNENELGSRAQFDSVGTEIAPARIGGRILLLVNAEVRRRLIGPLGAEIFVDGGNIWTRSEDIKLRNILSVADNAGYNDMRYSVGAGLRFATPIGPVRLDYGWKIRMARPSQPDPSTGRGAFHFSVGQAF